MRQQATKQLTVLVPVEWGPVARLLIRSGVLKRVVEMGARVVVASGVPDLSGLRRELDGTDIHVEPMRVPRQRLARWFSYVYSYLFWTMIPTVSSAVREEQMRLAQPVRYRIVRALKGRPLRALFQLWRFGYRLLLDNNQNRWLFDQYQPDLVVTTTMGRGLDEFNLLRLAQRRGVRTLCAVQSWDTLTTKEIPIERPDRMVTWNEQNKIEACSLYGFAPQNVYVAGAPHFDLYHHPGELPTRADHFAALGLDPDRQLLFVTGMAWKGTPVIETTLKTLAQVLGTEALAKPCQVLFRPHPAVYFGQRAGVGTEEHLREFEKLSPYIHVNRPMRANTGLWTDMEPAENTRIAATLYHSSVLLDFFGTLSVEACSVNRPVIYPALGESDGEFVGESMQWRSGLTHVQLVLNGGAGKLVTTADELVANLNRYLLNPEADCEGRARVAYEVLYKQDGRAGQRLALAIWAYANNTWPPVE